ncbi:hypothetical protein HAX54_043440, partial [Datura stramonium]|nr:hypothetical protein [Datura stramonium]
MGFGFGYGCEIHGNVSLMETGEREREIGCWKVLVWLVVAGAKVRGIEKMTRDDGREGPLASRKSLVGEIEARKQWVLREEGKEKGPVASDGEERRGRERKGVALGGKKMRKKIR